MARRRKGGQRKRRTPEIGMTTTTGGGDSSDCVDRISNLPIDVIHQIHSFLPCRDAVRTSILSHRWRTIWASYPIIYLNEVDFAKPYSGGFEEKRNGFLTCLKKTLDRCEHVETFILRMRAVTVSDGSLIKKCFDFASKNKVRTLYISLGSTYVPHFELRSIAFISSTLVELKMVHCRISNCCFMLPTLRLLFLLEVWIEDNDLKDLLAGCPRIEQFYMCLCGKLRNIVVSNPGLKHFGLFFPNSYVKVVIESKNLESLEFCFWKEFMCILEITSRTTIRNLALYGVNGQGRTLYGVNGQGRTWTDFINQFPLLEKLVMHCCKNLKDLYVSQRNLASLVLDLDDEVGLRIDALKLKSLKYTGGLTSFPGIETSKELECVQFDLNPEMLNARWYIWLRNILESFAHSKHLSLICGSEQAIIFPDELTEILLPTMKDLKNLELRINSSTSTSQQILDGFVWILPGLKTLSLTLGSITKFIEFPQ